MADKPDGPAPRGRRFRGRHGREVESRAKVLEKKVTTALEVQVSDLITQTVREFRGGRRSFRVRKADDDNLIKIINHHGLMMARQSGKRIQRGKFKFSPKFESDFFKRNKIPKGFSSCNGVLANRGPTPNR